MGKHFCWNAIGIGILLCAAASAQTFTKLVDFNYDNGANPTYMSLVQGLDGALYGTTTYGGIGNYGTVFKLTASGITSIHTLDLGAGGDPAGSLLLATDGNFYGTTQVGGGGVGGGGLGNVFRITPGGVLATFFVFGMPGVGGGPYAGVIQGTDGNFYGTTFYYGYGGGGAAFQLTPAGVEKTLHSFAFLGGPANGANPSAPLMQAGDGTLYGTTTAGGIGGQGEIYRINLAGSSKGEAQVYSFSGPDGANPYAGLVQASDGNLYGTTYNGGANGKGTIFKLTAGTLTTLHSFNSTDGAYPYAALIQATDGNLYGTTSSGGASGYGTVFQITPGGMLTNLHSFDSTDGANPNGGLTQATDGNLYGVTPKGGVHNRGTIYKLSMGLGPFVTALPTSGTAGQTIFILGTDLTNATSVTFNGASAAFTVVSASEITATVPAGASTGTIQVTGPSSTLSSNVAYRVR